MGDQVANEAASRPVHQNVRHGDHNQVMRAKTSCRRVYSKTLRSSENVGKWFLAVIARGIGRRNTWHKAITDCA